MKVRHPEKVNNPINPIKRKPYWIRTRILDTQNYFKTSEVINKKNSIKVFFLILLYGQAMTSLLIWFL